MRLTSRSKKAPASAASPSRRPSAPTAMVNSASSGLRPRLVSELPSVAPGCKVLCKASDTSSNT